MSEITIGPFIFGRFRNSRPSTHILMGRWHIQIRLGRFGFYVIVRR